MKKNISDEIICPCCGEKIYRNNAETKESVYGCYKICYKCGGSFSKLSPNINLSAVIEKWACILYLIIIPILALIYFYYDSKNESVSTIIGMSLVLLMVAPTILYCLWCVFGAVRGDFGDNRKNLNKSNNGFLPIFYSPPSISYKLLYRRYVLRIVPFVREDQLDIGTRELTNQNFPSYFAVLLPKPNIKASISHIADIDKIKLNDMYKIDLNGNNIYLILADYLVNDKDITLMLKCFDSTMINTIKDHGGIEIQTLDNEFVGRAHMLPM